MEGSVRKEERVGETDVKGEEPSSDCWSGVGE